MEKQTPPENSKKLVDPQTLKGFIDLLPEAMIARQTIIEKIRAIYEKYGAVPVDTPLLEHLVTLIGVGGEETNKQLFRLESPEREAIAMRFDLTVPFARLIAQYPDALKLPFRRYHIGSVFRADKPDPARFRQFTQCDMDIAGSESVAADAEMVSVMCEVLRAVGLTNEQEQEFQVRINHRKAMDAILIGHGLTQRETQKHVLRVVDKLQKVGLEAVRKELGPGRMDESGDPIRGVGLSPTVIESILAFIALHGNKYEAIRPALEKMLPDSEISQTVLCDMEAFSAAITSLPVNPRDILFDMSLTRGLDYYTDLVFEACLPSAPQFGSVMAGGRYDHLIERFRETRIPATGLSMGLDRLIAALIHLGKIAPVRTTTKVLVVAMPKTPMAELLSVASELRSENIPTDVYFGAQGTGMRHQLAWANAYEIPLAVMLGEDELKNNQVSIKDLRAGLKARADIQDHESFRKAGKAGQITVARSQLVPSVKSLLGVAMPTGAANKPRPLGAVESGGCD